MEGKPDGLGITPVAFTESSLATETTRGHYLSKYSIFNNVFIPKRTTKSWHSRFSLGMDSDSQDKDDENRDYSTVDNNNSLDSTQVYSSLLKNEILNSSITGPNSFLDDSTSSLFKYSPRNGSKENANYSRSPLGASSQRLLTAPKKEVGKISTVPYKVLDAPDLQDDFYLNLVDWSAQNVLGVGLGGSVYLWSACTTQVIGVCELPESHNCVTSVSWSPRGNHLAVGTHLGSILICDASTGKQLDQYTSHSGRVGTLAWNGDILTSGSRDRSIVQKDTRVGVRNRGERRLWGHKQEVCGLEWSPDGQFLASGGNDNKLFIWSLQSSTPVKIFDDHRAAVKAVAWSPHHHGLLATGGGTADRTIRFWNMITGQPLNHIDTGSQVCNLAWSKHSSQLVSTHGYAHNQILLWNYPSMTQVAKLTGHSFRVLYLAVSPDGESIVTGAGDETLRFWKMFSKTPPRPSPHSLLSLFTKIR